jgi:signal peptidase II
LFYILVLAVFALDRFFKQAAVSNLLPSATHPIIQGFLHLTYVRNTGVAFGLMQGQRALLIFTGIVVCIVIMWLYAKTDQNDLLLKLSFAMILGGSLGNLYDRIMYGFVIDYIDFRVFPVFNFADMMINVGILLVIVDLIFRGDNASGNS